MQELVAAQVVVGEPEVHPSGASGSLRQAGYDPANGRRRVKQLGTFATKRDALAHRKAVAAGRVGSDDEMLAECLKEPWSPRRRDLLYCR